MSNRIVRCQVVEVSADQSIRSERQPPRDLLPWADPYIARLMVKHRLECALAETNSRNAYDENASPESETASDSPAILPLRRFPNDSSRW